MENRTFAVVMTIGARRGGHGAMPSPWICNKVLKPNFQFMISQANNGCSLLLHILAKLQLLDISCGNIFAVSIVTACPFSIKKCAKMSVLYVKIVKNRWRLGAMSPHPLGFQRHRRPGGFTPWGFRTGGLPTHHRRPGGFTP